MRSRPEVRKQRKQLAEHPFGTMKRWGDAGYFLMRGLEKVRTECSLTVLAYNLRRVLHLVALPRLLAALGCDVLGRGVVVRAAVPAGGLGRVPEQASSCRKQRRSSTEGFHTVSRLVGR